MSSVPRVAGREDEAADLRERRNEAAVRTRTSPNGGRPKPAGNLRPVVARVSRMHEIAEILRNSIVSGELAPRSLHSVGALAETLGVSRTPVREALIELMTRGLVKFERNRGVRILQASVEDVENIYEVRRMLEVPIVGKIIANITPEAIEGLQSILRQQEAAALEQDEIREWELDREFHYTLLVQSGNHYIADYLDQLRDKVFVRRATTVGMERHTDGVGGDHQRILDAIERADVQGAEEEVLGHLLRSRALYGQ